MSDWGHLRLADFHLARYALEVVVRSFLSHFAPR